MTSVHTLWANAVGWLGLPWRICLFALVVLLLVTQVMPPLLRGLGRSIETGAEPALLLMTYPEYLATTLSRRYHRRLLPGTFAYDRALGTIAELARRAGTGLGRVGQVKPGFPRRTFIGASIVVIALWYSQDADLNPDAQEKFQPVRVELVRLDTWLGTGEWTPRTVAPPDPGAGCPPAEKKAPPKKKKRST